MEITSGLIEVIEKEILEEFGDWAKSYGFAYLPGTDLFVRRTAFGAHRVRIPIEPSNDGGMIAHLFLQIRVDRVDEFYVSGLSFLKDEKHMRLLKITPSEWLLQAATLDVEIDRLDNFAVPTGWSFYRFEEASRIVEGMKEQLLRYGLPYFEHHSSLEAVFETLMDDSEFGVINCLSVTAQSALRVIMAKYLGKDEAFISRLIDEGYRRVRNANGREVHFTDHIENLDEWTW